MEEVTGPLTDSGSYSDCLCPPMHMAVAYLSYGRIDSLRHSSIKQLHCLYPIVFNILQASE